MTDLTPADREHEPPEPGAASDQTPRDATAPAPSVGAESAVEAPPARAGRRSSVVGYLAVAVLGVVIGAGGLAVANGSLGASATPSPSPTPAAAPADNAVGLADAPVTLEVWADYQCPYCRLDALLFGGAIDREYVMTGVIRIVYRDFAFLGQESTDAAVAARCAGRQEPAARLRFRDALYTFQQGENQGRFVRDNLLQLAQVVGVADMTSFTACLDDPAVGAEVAAETTTGRNVGVASTPTLRLHGPGGERVLTGFSQTWPTLRDAIEAVRVPAASPSPSASPAASGSRAPSPPPAASASPASPSPSATAAP